MKKEDLDALAGLYEGVYSSNSGEYLSETYIDEQLKGFDGKPIPVSAADKKRAENEARFQQRAATYKAKGGSNYAAYLAGGGNKAKSLSPSAAPQDIERQGRAALNAKAAKDKIANASQADKNKAAENIFKLKPGSLTKPATKPATQPATRPAATQPAANKPATPGAGAKVAPTAAKSAGQTGDKAKDMATWAKANPTLANKPKTPNPLMQKTFGYQTGNAPDQVAKTAAATAKAGSNLTGTGALAPKPTPSTTPIRKPGAVMASFEWGSKATLKDVASLYNSIYEGKKKDQDQDGDNDFADVRIARMIASGMSKAEAIAAVKNKEYNEEFESWVDSLVEEGYDLSNYTMDEMFDIYLDEAEGSYGATPKAYSAARKTKMTAKRKPFLKKMLSRTNPANRTSPYDSPRKGLTADDRERARAGSKHGVGTRQDHDYPSEGPGGITKSTKKLRKQKAMGEFGEAYEIDEATRMRKELGKEGETATRKELAARSKAYKRSGSVDKTIAAAERGADRPYIKHKRDESDADRKKREERQSRTLRGLASSRRGSVRDKPRVQLRGYAAKVEGSDKDLQRARSSAMSAGTLTPKEKKQLGEEYAIYEIVASYLLENNFAETLDDANVIIENMSEVWLDEILEAKKSLPVAKMKRKESKLLDNEEGQLQALRTDVGSKERKARMKELQRFDNINSVRTSVAKRGGKQQHSMPEIGRYKPKEED